MIHKPNLSFYKGISEQQVFTQVVHCKKSDYDIYIGRPSKWGNPFSHREETSAEFKVGSRAEAIQKYEELYNISGTYLKMSKDLSDSVRDHGFKKTHNELKDVLRGVLKQ